METEPINYWEPWQDKEQDEEEKDKEAEEIELSTQANEEETADSEISWW